MVTYDIGVRSNHTVDDMARSDMVSYNRVFFFLLWAELPLASSTLTPCAWASVLGCGCLRTAQEHSVVHLEQQHDVADAGPDQRTRRRGDQAQPHLRGPSSEPEHAVLAAGMRGVHLGDQLHLPCGVCHRHRPQSHQPRGRAIQHRCTCTVCAHLTARPCPYGWVCHCYGILLVSTLE